MVNRKVKFKISVKELAFEFEGDAETGQRLQQGIQDSLGTIIDMPGRVVLPLEHNGPIIDASSSPDGEAGLTPAELPVQPEAKRATRKTSRPKGTSAAARIKALRDEGFFSQERSAGEVQEALAHRGYTFEPKEIAAALLQVLRKQLLDRRQNDKGNYIYFEKATSNGQGGSGAATE
jgi:hypothetical protein